MRPPAEHVYRVLLRVFPREFVALHGDSMTAEVLQQHHALAGRPVKRLALWIRIIGDALRHGLGVRRDRARGVVRDRFNQQQAGSKLCIPRNRSSNDWQHPVKA
jgi:hypothetical protein